MHAGIMPITCACTHKIQAMPPFPLALAFARPHLQYLSVHGALHVHEPTPGAARRHAAALRIVVPAPAHGHQVRLQQQAEVVVQLATLNAPVTKRRGSVLTPQDSEKRPYLFIFSIPFYFLSFCKDPNTSSIAGRCSKVRGRMRT